MESPVAFRNPQEIWETHKSFLLCEVAFYVGAFLTLTHGKNGPKLFSVLNTVRSLFAAVRSGGRHVYLWVAILFHGFVTELISYSMPDIDNFWHAQSMVMFLGRRLPLHILCLCEFSLIMIF